MATPDVRVRLSPEGLQEVLHAFKQIQDQSDKTGKKVTGSFASLKGIAVELGALLPALGGAAAIAGLAKLGQTGLNTADDMGKMAQKTGSAVEGLSILAVAAQTADVSNQQLQTGLIQLAKNTANLKNGNDEAAASFKAIGLEAKDLQGLSTDQIFVKVAENLAKVENSGDKTALTLKLLGKQGAELIPLLNDVGQQGFAALAEEAQRLNLVIDADTAAAADAANDAFTRIGQQVKGTAVQFAAGFAPAVAQAMTSFSESMEGGGDKVRSFGRGVGKVIGIVVNLFITLKNIVANTFQTVGNLVGGLFATLNQVVRGNFEEAGNIFRDTFATAFQDVSGLAGEFQDNLGKLLFDAMEDVPAPVIKPTIDTSALADFDTAEEQRAKEKAEKDAQRAADLAKRKADAEAKEQQRLADQRAQFEAKILELQGRHREAALRALDQEAAKLDLILQKQGVAADQRAAQVEQFRALSTAQIDATEALANANRELDALARDRQRIENEVALGQLSQIEAQEQLRTIEAQRLAVLQQMAAAALAAAQATGDPEAIARAQQLNLEVQNLQVNVKKTGEEFGRFKEAAIDSAGSQVVGLFDQLIRQQGDFGDAARGAALAVVDTIRQIAAELLKAQIVKYLSSLFGVSGQLGTAAGSALGAAGGGHVTGPGTGTSDSIPARLSDGEFVVRAAVVRQPGVLEALTRLNRGMRPARGGGRQRFASGGLVASQPAQQQGGGSDAVRIVNVLDATMVTDAISSPAGERTVLNTIKRNSGSLRAIFGG